MLPKPNRLKKDKDFASLFAKGRGTFHPVVSVKCRPNRLSLSRFAVVVGTKVSKSAVVRNRLRRQIREVVRLRLPGLCQGYDVALLVRPEAKKSSFASLESAVLNVLEKASLFKRVGSTVCAKQKL
ncbi:MAG TPA: ribonuclease P protein component [Patescibacteria group bacterium]|nr:ribonuclease P protein component [Patescibacteria group bacterium]